MEECMEGYLEKKSALFGSRWKKQWFVLSDKRLTRFKTPEEAKLGGNRKVFLDFGAEVELVRPSTSTIKLAASDESERRKWLNVFHLALGSGPSISSPIKRKSTDKRKSLPAVSVEVTATDEDGGDLEVVSDQLRVKSSTCFSPSASVFFTSDQYKNWPRLSMNLYDEVVEQVNNKLFNQTISDQNTQTDFASDDEDQQQIQ
ncbi:hypothetical protein CHUAL_003096 [Chamberlinius hualienensis]